MRTGWHRCVRAEASVTVKPCEARSVSGARIVSIHLCKTFMRIGRPAALEVVGISSIVGSVGVGMMCAGR